MKLREITLFEVLEVAVALILILSLVLIIFTKFYIVGIILFVVWLILYNIIYENVDTSFEANAKDAIILAAIMKLLK